MFNIFSWPSLISLSAATALSVGHIMQITAAPTATIHNVAAGVELSNITFASATIPTETSAMIDDPIKELRQTDLIRLTVPRPDGPRPEIAQNICAPDVQADILPNAMIALSVTAPCLANTSYTIHHNGMMVSAKLNDQGLSDITIPALADHAVVMIDLPNSTPIVTAMAIPDMANLNRAVVQWTGQASLMIASLDASIVGASYDMIAAGERHAAVFTTENGTALPDLAISALHDETLCGGPIDFQTLIKSPNAQTTVRDYHVESVACVTKGETLVLKNIFQTTTVANR